MVVVAHNSRDHVLACLASLEAHAPPATEVVVVDDGSDDGTVAAVRGQFPAATVHALDVNQGLVAGRNAALGVVRGRYVLMLDADTEVHPGAIEAMVAALEDDPGVGLVGPRLVYPDGRLQLSCRRYPPALLPILRRGPLAKLRPDPAKHRWHLMQDFGHDAARPVVWVAGAAQMWPRALAERLGPYDRRVSSYGGEDLDWCLRVWRAGLEVRYVPDAVVTHVFRQVTRQKPFGRKSWRALRDHVYLQLKHRGLRRDPRLAPALR